MEQDTIPIPTHLDGDGRTAPAWAVLCVVVGTAFLVCASAFFATINLGRLP